MLSECWTNWKANYLVLVFRITAMPISAHCTYLYVYVFLWGFFCLFFMRNLHTCSCTEIPIFVSNLSVTQQIHRIPAVGCENLWHHAYNVKTSFTPTLKTTCLKNLPLISVKNKVAKTRLDLGSPCNTDSVGTEPCCVLHVVSLCPVLHKNVPSHASSLFAQHGNQWEMNLHFMLKLARPVPKAAGNFISE